MFPVTIPDFIFTMAAGLFLMALICLSTGIYLLVSKAGGRDVKAIADQATKLAQKGLAEEVAGLVGNASSLVDALNQLARTGAGIGVFLVLVSFLLTGVAYFLVVNIP
ncbi:MAG: hypothetical protein M1281_06545 [Chloroflexi bacterium]|nr:hypothetical protein [Chloroflexota bacterium]